MVKVVISYPETGTAEQVEVSIESLLGKSIGDEIDGKIIGLDGKARITGGSDRDGFPMRRSIPGTARKKTLLESKKRRSIRGREIGYDIEQINVVKI